MIKRICIEEKTVQMNPYLVFNGRCEAAFKFYEQNLGGKMEMMMTYGESPMAEQCTPESRDKIMHACLRVDNNLLMGSDGPAGYDEEAKGFYVSLGIDDPAEAERLFQVLLEKGTVHMPIQETFWATRFGMLVDQFGTPWMVNCEKPK
jgi:PhnB protein